MSGNWNKLPRWLDFGGSLEYRQNGVTMMEDGVNLSVGTLFIIERKGLLWRNFTTTMEKYIAFGNIKGFQIIRRKDVSNSNDANAYFELNTKWPIITTYDNNNVGGTEILRNEISGSEKMVEVGAGNQKSTCSGTSVKFILDECDLNELNWYVQKYFTDWIEAGGDFGLLKEELLLHPPGQFDDVVFPKPLDGNGELAKKRAEMRAAYEAQIKKFGPLKEEKGKLTGYHLLNYAYNRPQFKQIRPPTLCTNREQYIKWALSCREIHFSKPRVNDDDDWDPIDRFADAEEEEPGIKLPQEESP